MKSIVSVIYIIFAISAIQCSKNDHAINGDIKVCFVHERDVMSKLVAQNEKICPEPMALCNDVCCPIGWECSDFNGRNICLPHTDPDMPHGSGHIHIDLFDRNNTQ